MSPIGRFATACGRVFCHAPCAAHVVGRVRFPIARRSFPRRFFAPFSLPFLSRHMSVANAQEASDVFFYDEADSENEVLEDMASDSLLGPGELFLDTRGPESNLTPPKSLTSRVEDQLKTLEPHVPLTINGVPVLEDLFFRNEANKSLVNERLMSILTHETVLHHGFLSKKRRVRLPYKFKPEGMREIHSVDRTALQSIARQLNSPEFAFAPRKIVESETPTGAVRPIGVACPRDQIILEAIKLVLEAIFEPTFSVYGHGFRPLRGRQSAVRDVKRYFRGMDHFLVCELADPLHEFRGYEMVEEACKRIGDGDFEQLLYKALDAGYVDYCGLNSKALVNKPKVSGISPVLLHIYLSKLDRFLSDMKDNMSEMEFENVEHVSVGSHRRLRFVRCADTVLIGLRCMRLEALEVAKKVEDFLVSELKMNQDLTRVTVHGASEQKVSRQARFLGYKIRLQRLDDDTPEHLKASVRLQLRPMMVIPVRELFTMLIKMGYTNPRKNFRPMGVTHMTLWTCHEIVRYFDRQVGALLEYYSQADNFRSLADFVYILKTSCVLTLGLKLKLNSLRKVYLRFGPDLEVTEGGRVIARFRKRSLKHRPTISEFYPGHEKAFTGYGTVYEATSKEDVRQEKRDREWIKSVWAEDRERKQSEGQFESWGGSSSEGQMEGRLKSQKRPSLKEGARKEAGGWLDESVKSFGAGQQRSRRRGDSNKDELKSRVRSSVAGYAGSSDVSLPRKRGRMTTGYEGELESTRDGEERNHRDGDEETVPDYGMFQESIHEQQTSRYSEQDWYDEQASYSGEHTQPAGTELEIKETTPPYKDATAASKEYKVEEDWEELSDDAGNPSWWSSGVSDSYRYRWSTVKDKHRARPSM